MKLMSMRSYSAAIALATSVALLAVSAQPRPGTMTGNGTAQDEIGNTVQFDMSAALTDGPPAGSISLSAKTVDRANTVSVATTELTALHFKEGTVHVLGPAIMRKPGPVGPAEFHGNLEVWVTGGDTSSLKAVFHSVEGYDAWEFSGQVKSGKIVITPPEAPITAR